jgi:hypothetical protein
MINPESAYKCAGGHGQGFQNGGRASRLYEGYAIAFTWIMGTVLLLHLFTDKEYDLCRRMAAKGCLIPVQEPSRRQGFLNKVSLPK